MGEITEADKKFARKLGDLFGGKFSVHGFGDEAERSFVDILSCVDSPSKGLTAHATLDLHKHRNLVGKPPIDVRVELIAICESKVKDFARALSTAAFCIINSKWKCAPGVVFPDVISMYRMSHTMSHVLFGPPIPWDRELGRVKIGRQKVHCLSMIPISEAEYRYLEKHGSGQLEDLLARKKVDFANINRTSVV